jgi:hypothetical protein
MRDLSPERFESLQRTICEESGSALFVQAYTSVVDQISKRWKGSENLSASVSLEPLEQALLKISNRESRLKIEKALNCLSQDLEWIAQVNETLVSRERGRSSSVLGSVIERLTSWWQIRQEKSALVRFSRVFENI